MAGRPGAGQGLLFEADRIVSSDLLGDPTKRSFSWAIGALNPIFANQHFEDITDIDTQAARPDVFRSALFTEGAFTINGLAVNEDEYKLIPRNAKAIEAQVSATTLRAKALDPNLDRRAATANQKSGQALIVYGNRDGLMNWLGNEADSLKKLRNEIRSPGSRHRLDASDWLLLLNGVIQFSFGNIVHVAGLQSQWTADQQKKTDRAMMFNLSKAHQPKRMTYWTDMTDLAIDYNRKKTLLFTSKIRSAKQLGEQALEKSKRT